MHPRAASQLTTSHFKAGRTRRRGRDRRGRLARQAVVEAHLVGQAAQVAVARLAVVAALREADRQVAEVAIDCTRTKGASADWCLVAWSLMHNKDTALRLHFRVSFSVLTCLASG